MWKHTSVVLKKNGSGSVLPPIPTFFEFNYCPFRSAAPEQFPRPPHLLDSFLFVERASVLPDHAHFLATETCIFDRHAEERVFVLLVVGSKRVLVEQHQFRVIRAGFREVGKVLSNRSDQAGLSLHSFVVGHGAMRIADSERAQILQVKNMLQRG